MWNVGAEGEMYYYWPLGSRWSFAPRGTLFVASWLESQDYATLGQSRPSGYLGASDGF